VSDQVSHPYKTTGKVIVQYILKSARYSNHYLFVSFKTLKPNGYLMFSRLISHICYFLLSQ
jgi:hypothetical protein